MGLFGFGGGAKKEGGLMDVIRCDEQEYLVWKWRPSGEADSTKKENSIRWGSSLRVKDGEVAVFVYKQKDGTMQDFIEGPFDETIKTANFPILTGILGLAYDGNSPFQAEIYFINLSGVIQVKFGIPYFDVYDPRFLDFGVPMAVRGTLTFNITDYKAFIKLHRLINFDLEEFSSQVKDAVIKRVKSFVANAPTDYQLPVLQIERRIAEVSDLIQEKLKGEFAEDFGVNVKRLDLSAIDVDKESEGYHELRRVTAAQQEKTIIAQTDVNVKNMEDMQRINAANMEESLRIQREEAQRAQRLQTETNFMGAHALDQQTEVMRTGMSSLGNMTNMGGGGNMNPAGMMTGMMMGGALGNQMAGMMNQMGGTMQQAANTPPPAPVSQYYVAINGQQSGPFSVPQLQQLAQQGQINIQTLVWKQGMAGWEPIANVAEVASALMPQTPPAMPPMPPQTPPAL